MVGYIGYIMSNIYNAQPSVSDSNYEYLELGYFLKI
jgi:hypothetical protein